MQKGLRLAHQLFVQFTPDECLRVSNTCRRPVFYVASDVHDGVLIAVVGGAERVALTHAHRVRGGHGVDGHVADLHADDEAATGAHAAAAHRRC